MGLSRASIRILLRALKPFECGGSVITFGNQKLAVSSLAELESLFLAEGFRPRSSVPVRFQDFGDGDRCVHQDVLFSLMGFDSSESVDYFGDENPDRLIDLNKPVPAEMEGRHALVLDGGTAEHCFNVPQVLANAVRLCRPGGFVCHISPLSGFVDHGFYSFSPTLYADFYSANAFSDIRIFALYTGVISGKTCLLEYSPRNAELMRSISLRGLLVCIARKPAGWNLPETVMPVQGYYRKIFGQERPAAKFLSAPSAPGRGLGALARRLLGRRLSGKLYDIRTVMRKCWFLLTAGNIG